MRENRYQPRLIDRLERRFPGCIVIRLDPRFVDFYIDGDKFSQGVMDLLVLWRGRVGALETKRASNSRRQPNQDYFIEAFGDVCFSAFICPENEEDVLHDLQQAFSSRRSARVSQR